MSTCECAVAMMFSQSEEDFYWYDPQALLVGSRMDDNARRLPGGDMASYHRSKRRRLSTLPLSLLKMTMLSEVLFV